MEQQAQSFNFIDPITLYVHAYLMVLPDNKHYWKFRRSEKTWSKPVVISESESAKYYKYLKKDKKLKMVAK